MSDLLETLNQRLVAGEISEEQYDSIKSRLVTEEHAVQQAQQQYGQPVGSGGAVPSRPTNNPRGPDAIKDRVRNRLERGDGLMDSQGKIDSIQYQNIRFAEGVEAAIRNPSYRSFSRSAADDKQVKDDRLARRGKQGGSL